MTTPQRGRRISKVNQVRHCPRTRLALLIIQNHVSPEPPPSFFLLFPKNASLFARLPPNWTIRSRHDKSRGTQDHDDITSRSSQETHKRHLFKSLAREGNHRGSFRFMPRATSIESPTSIWYSHRTVGVAFFTSVCLVAGILPGQTLSLNAVSVQVRPECRCNCPLRPLVSLT
jgi:hypothetical protein